MPCIIRYPGVVEPGTESQVAVHGCDLLPTVASISGAELPKDRILDGVDISPVLRQQDFSRVNPLFWAFKTRQYDDPYGYQYAARKDNWKIITDEEVDKVFVVQLGKRSL